MRKTQSFPWPELDFTEFLEQTSRRGNWSHSTESLRLREAQQEVGDQNSSALWHQVSSKPPDSKVNVKKKKDQSLNATHILHFLEANHQSGLTNSREIRWNHRNYLKERKKSLRCILDVANVFELQNLY